MSLSETRPKSNGHHVNGAAVLRLGEALGVLVVLIHHTGKDASKGARGHSSLFAALDTAIELQHHEETGARSIRLAKVKDEGGGRTWGFRLKQVSLGVDADGDPVTSCVVEYTDAPNPKRRDKAQEAAEGIVLDALKAVLSTDGRRAPACVPVPAGTFVAPLKLVRERAFKIGLSKDGKADSAKRMSWNRALEKLAKPGGKVGVWDDEDSGKEAWLWLKS